MKRIALGLSVLGLVAFAPPQERVKKKGPPKFVDHAQAAIKAFNERKLSVANAHWKKAGIGLTMARREVLRNAFPAAEGAKIKDKMQFEKGFNNPMMGMLGGALGNMLERTYQWEGNKRIRLTVTLDSPMAKMWGGMQMGAANDPNSEVVNYAGDLTAVLKKRGSGAELQMMIEGAHFNLSTSNINDDDLLKFWSDAVVQPVKTALSK